MSASGVYKFTRFRSQLEIRFAKELDQREIKWFYEPERLGKCRYLVDFYLPQCKSWVEVKGVVDSRDHDSLLELCILLQKERRQRIFMWMDKKAFHITEQGYKPLTHEQFWELVLIMPASEVNADIPALLTEKRLIRPE